MSVIRVRAVMNEWVVPVDEQDAAGRPSPDRDWDIVDEWGNDSFPASDPPANW